MGDSAFFIKDEKSVTDLFRFVLWPDDISCQQPLPKAPQNMKIDWTGRQPHGYNA